MGVGGGGGGEEVRGGEARDEMKCNSVRSSFTSVNISSVLSPNCRSFIFSPFIKKQQPTLLVSYRIAHVTLANGRRRFLHSFISYEETHDLEKRMAEMLARA